MQSTPSPKNIVYTQPGMQVMMSLSALYHYMYCMVISSSMSLSPVFGGALLLSARAGNMLIQMLFGNRRRYLSNGTRIVGIVLLVVMILCSVLLLAVYPLLMSTYTMWVIFAVVLLITMRGILARRLVTKLIRNTISRKAALLLALLEAVPLCIGALLLFNALPAVPAWQIFGGLALGALLEGYSLWREKEQIAAAETPAGLDEKTLRQIGKDLRAMGAYHSYERFHMLIMMALQLTLVMMYTFIGLTGEELFTCLLMAVGVTMVFPELTGLLLKNIKNKKPAATQLLLLGLFLWIYGLTLFYTRLGQSHNLMLNYLSLGLSVGGLTISTACLGELERQMTSVAQYGLQNHTTGYEQMRAGQTEAALLLGQMIALALLTALCFPSEFSWAQVAAGSLAQNFRPLMIVPPMLLLISAFVGVLHFPMNSRYFLKLRRLLTLKGEGGDNPALEKQLEKVVVKKHKNRFGIRMLIVLLRPLYYHKVLGTSNIADYEDGTMILVCNHGEIYGPIVANLYIPISFRPWVLAHMMDREAIVEHMYQGTMVRQKWIPNRLKKPLVRLVSPLLQWIFESIESIPVYRGGNPRALVKTFRLTIEALQAGDNILLFPENGESRTDGGKGYVQEGVGRLYTGFAMIAPAYYKKTGKQAVFVPVYASKRLRTLTIGNGILYNPNAPANDEKLRIVDALLTDMQAMYAQETAEAEKQREKAQSKKKK